MIRFVQFCIYDNAFRRGILHQISTDAHTTGVGLCSFYAVVEDCLTRELHSVPVTGETLRFEEATEKVVEAQRREQQQQQQQAMQAAMLRGGVPIIGGR